MKIAIKREQSDARIGSAERKQFRALLTFRRLFSRAAAMLVLMVLTTATAWAIKTETPVTYSMSCSNGTVTIMNGSTVTATWSGTPFGAERHWVTNDIHNLSNGMTIKPSADVYVHSDFPTTKTSTTFTFTAPNNIAITGVTFMYRSTVVDATSSEPGTTFKVTLDGLKTFTGFVVTYGYISGTCEGSITTWSLDKENGHYTALTIGGSGEMSGSNAPWGTDLTSATIGSGFTAIGNNAFNGYTALKRVNIQKTDGLVTLISSAFDGCNALQYIVAPTPTLALQYKSATNWSAYAEKMRADFGGYAFRIDYTNAADAAYAVADADDLRNLAAAVNAGNNGSSQTFRQTDDITFTGGSNTQSNYTAIGNEYHPFRGTFDGQNHVVRGIRIYQGDNNPDVDDYQGLFGNIGSGAKVKNIILADARITGFNLTGGIAGYNSGTIENCHAFSNVTVHAVQSTCYHHGGIVGANRLDGTVTGCTSAAAVTTADNLTNCTNYGGIAGLNSATVKDCIYLGTTVEGNKNVGAIVGSDSSTVPNCYFTNANIAFGSDTNVGLAPQDAADNSGFISLMAARNTALTAHSHTPAVSTAVDITLRGRTLQTGGWNTFCVPFDAAIPSGWTVKKLTGSGLSDGTLTLNFADATSIEAGKPYLVKVPAAVANPQFSGVTVADGTTTTETTYVDFVPVMNPTPLTGGDKTVLFVTGGNKLTYPTADGNINAFRAYFQLKGVAAQARAFTMSFDDDATGIAPLLSPEGASWYTLDGRRIEGKPTMRGIYVSNGRKIVVK